MENRLKPNDLKSENTMILTNKKGRKKTSKLISKSKDDRKVYGYSIKNFKKNLHALVETL